MRISHSLALGRTLIYPIAGTHLNTDQTGGCAWGMIQTATPNEYARMINQANGMVVTLPCECKDLIVGGGMRLLASSGRESLMSAIIHLFNYHVMTKKDWTMEKVIDYVASVEPPDPLESVTTSHVESHVEEKVQERVAA